MAWCRIRGYPCCGDRRSKGALLDILTEMGSVPKDLQERLQGLDEETLRIWTKFAVKVESMDDFLEKIK